MHTPDWLTIPVAVVVRFLPVLVEEAKAIVEAMALRGLRPGAVGVLAHPLRYGQYVLLPLVSSAVRIGDELSASALIRGLGGPSGAPAPSSATALRFTAADALLLLCVAGLLVLRLVSPEVRP